MQGWQQPQKSKKYVRGFWVFGGFFLGFWGFSLSKIYQEKI